MKHRCLFISAILSFVLVFLPLNLAMGNPVQTEKANVFVVYDHVAPFVENGLVIGICDIHSSFLNGGELGNCRTFEKIADDLGIDLITPAFDLRTRSSIAIYGYRPVKQGGSGQ